MSTVNGKVVERETWDKKIDFTLSCIGYAVGLGNIWRFPYLCYRNGGGAFLVPYLIFLCICGIPLFFLELSLGQFGALGPVSIWKIAPLFKGVGYCMIIISFVVCVYYNVIIAYSLHFIFHSLTSTLPWGNCGNYWNTELCRDKSYNMSSSIPPAAYGINCSTGWGWSEATGTTNVTIMDTNSTSLTDLGINTTVNGSCVQFKTAAQEYFTNKVLRLTSNIDVPGGMQWELLGFLILAWIVVFVCLFKGVKWSGKVVYFTATFPYLVLIILLIRGAMEPGAYTGIAYYITPNVTKLQDIRVWSDAAVQIFYSLGAAWGVLLSYSSLNKFNNNVYRDALTICTINCGTSILSGFVVFSILGALAHQTGREIQEVVDQGPGLAFVAYPAAVASLPCAPLWAFLFFFMLLNLGLDSQFGMIEAVVNGLLDEFPILRRNRVKFLAVLCLTQFLLAIPMVTESGMYWVTLIDWYASGFPLMVAALCEIGCIAWVYGVDRFLYDIKCMIGYTPTGWRWWYLAWIFITPLCIFMLIITYLAFYSPATYDGTTFPVWAEVLGWLSAMLSILAIPGWAVYQLCRHPRAKGNFKQRLRAMLKHDPDWGPRDPTIKYKYRSEVMCVDGAELKGHDEKELMSEARGESRASDVSGPPSYNEAL